LVGRKRSEDPWVSELPQLPLEYEATYGIERWLSLEGLGAPSSVRTARNMDSDIINLHNLHGSYFNLLSLLQLNEQAELFWTLHDTWPVTGNCVYPYGCERFTDSCGQCPQLSTYPSMVFDTTPQLLQLKRWLLGQVSITAICPSMWMLNLAERSVIPFDELIHIPNGVDVIRFNPTPTDEARRELNLEPDTLTILFVAQSLDDPRKGFSEFTSAVEQAHFDRPVSVLAVGNNPPTKAAFPDHIMYQPLGYVSDELLPTVYSAADLFVVPSLADNCPLTVLESMACGTPVVSFPVGGIPELIEDGGGWICKEVSPDSLARTLEGIAANQEDRSAEAQCAREVVEQSHDIRDVVRAYLDTYNVRGDLY
jgi:glycosyltransferase involved in cell wall biosynthesis